MLTSWLYVHMPSPLPHLQSPTFLRMLALGLVELLLVNTFPELQALVLDVRSGKLP